MYDDLIVHKLERKRHIGNGKAFEIIWEIAHLEIKRIHDNVKVE